MVGWMGTRTEVCSVVEVRGRWPVVPFGVLISRRRRWRRRQRQCASLTRLYGDYWLVLWWIQIWMNRGCMDWLSYCLVVYCVLCIHCNPLSVVVSHSLYCTVYVPMDLVSRACHDTTILWRRRAHSYSLCLFCASSLTTLDPGGHLSALWPVSYGPW